MKAKTKHESKKEATIQRFSLYLGMIVKSAEKVLTHLNTDSLHSILTLNHRLISITYHFKYSLLQIIILEYWTILVTSHCPWEVISSISAIIVCVAARMAESTWFPGLSFGVDCVFQNWEFLSFSLQKVNAIIVITTPCAISVGCFTSEEGLALVQFQSHFWKCWSQFQSHLWKCWSEALHKYIQLVIPPNYLGNCRIHFHRNFAQPFLILVPYNKPIHTASGHWFRYSPHTNTVPSVMMMGTYKTIIRI